MDQSSPKFCWRCYSPKPLTMQNFVAIDKKMPEISAIKNLCSPKKCLSGPSYGLLDRSGNKNWSIWWPACPGSVWKWFWVKRCLLNGPKASDRHPDGQTNRQTFMISVKMHPKEVQRPSGHKVHQIREQISICQTPNCAKFCNNPTRSVRDVNNQKFVTWKSGPKFTKIF